jgi:hypothetical protein
LFSMALTDNPFIGLPLADIKALRAAATQAILDVLKVGRSNSFPGWQITRETLPAMVEIAGQLRVAEEYTSGTGGKQIAYATINTSRQFSGRWP